MHGGLLLLDYYFYASRHGQQVQPMHRSALDGLATEVQREIPAIGQMLAHISVIRAAWLTGLARGIAPHRVIEIRQINNPPKICAVGIQGIEPARAFHRRQIKLR